MTTWTEPIALPAEILDMIWHHAVVHTVLDSSRYLSNTVFDSKGCHGLSPTKNLRHPLLNLYLVSKAINQDIRRVVNLEFPNGLGIHLTVQWEECRPTKAGARARVERAIPWAQHKMTLLMFCQRVGDATRR
jgi:hypothetical protein